MGEWVNREDLIGRVFMGKRGALRVVKGAYKTRLGAYVFSLKNMKTGASDTFGQSYALSHMTLLPLQNEGNGSHGSGK